MLVIISCFAVGRTFYVAMSGDNDNPGTINRPWRTIGFAVGSLSGVGAGDTIMVRAGNYPETVVPEVLGSTLRSAPIRLWNRP